MLYGSSMWSAPVRGTKVKVESMCAVMDQGQIQDFPLGAPMLLGGLEGGLPIDPPMGMMQWFIPLFTGILGGNIR